MTNDIYNTTADRLRAALSAEWCDLYGHKSEWSAAVDKAWDEEQKASKAANDAEDAGEEEARSVPCMILRKLYMKNVRSDRNAQTISKKQWN